MTFPAAYFHRFRWLNVPGALLMLLLQRTPVLRVVIVAEEMVIASPVGAVLRSAAAVLGSLGALHSLAGATTFLVQQGQTVIIRDGDPPRVNNPATGTAGSPLQPVLFTVLGALTPAGSYQITNLPPGLTVQGMNSNGILNASTGFISGTPTTAGTFSTRVLAFEFPNGPAQVLNDTVGPITITFTFAGVANVAPQIISQPVGQIVAPGGSVTFSVGATGSPAPTYQWQRNGVAITGATTTSLSLPSVQATDAGDYRVVVRNDAGTVTSDSATLSVVTASSAARLSNLSVRTTMAASQTLIVGVVVSGGSRDILMRAGGPALAALGVGNAMNDPRLDLSSGASNDNWDASLTATFTSVGAFGFPIGSKDAALLQTVSGPISILARGTGGGVVLVEAYDTGAPGAAHLINVSARNRAGTGDDILIAGFTIAGTGSKPLLIRAVGPKLSGFGVSGFLVDPKLEIFSGATKLVENDNWDASLAATFSAVGAFALDPGSKDAALLTSLPPGGYTVQVRGADGGTGEALVEIYEAP